MTQDTEPAPKTPSLEQPISPEFWQGKTVLIVDDEESVLGLANAIFKRNAVGTRILLAESGQEAVRQIQEEIAAGRQIDLVFTDYVMGKGMHGPDLIKWIRGQKELKQTIVAIASGTEFNKLDDYQLKEAAKNLQADAAIAKPYDIRELPITLAKAMRQNP